MSMRNDQASAASAPAAIAALIGGAASGTSAIVSANTCTTQIVWRRRLGGSGARIQRHSAPAATKA